MSSYWSCSKFADWLRGKAKPRSATSEEWDAWEKQAKEKRIRYWLAEEGLDYLQQFLFSPATLYRFIRRYIRNRWVNKSHALTSKLKKGEWHDLDSRILHSLFNEFVDFIETEQAWSYAQTDKKLYKCQWHDLFFRFKSWRNIDAGMAYLDWASKLTYDNHNHLKDKNLSNQLTPQAKAAKESLVLYNWWKHERPNRLDLYKMEGEDIDSGCLLKTFSEYDSAKKRMDIEQERNEEDTEMLIRLIKIRQNLWT